MEEKEGAEEAERTGTLSSSLHTKSNKRVIKTASQPATHINVYKHTHTHISLASQTCIHSSVHLYFYLSVVGFIWPERSFFCIQHNNTALN